LVAGPGRGPTIYLTARQRGRTDQSLSFRFERKPFFGNIPAGKRNSTGLRKLEELEIGFLIWELLVSEAKETLG